ncbi:helicase HerA-like domain-containing protein [Paracoccus aminophilus]|uniref:Helicase n=1 Tax=Paracoccus aminophilus JCM 7686 TaxID=1367847 RepID=S5XMH9_PARAH|nr:helicase HerA-like domain-containing protein [Paracoccus aminophilus]AGT08494.1 helicase [Paracoccus aminophilus JCM 7686]
MLKAINLEEGTVFVGGGGEGYHSPQTLLLKYANRHGLIAGATGTGKTVTLQTLAESFSLAGVPVFLADVKGDLAGLSQIGGGDAKLAASFQSRAETIGCEMEYQAFPVTFWDVWGEEGHPVRTTPTEMGPLLLSRLMGLTDAQEGVLNIAFRAADEQGLALLDLKDLQSMLVWVGQNAKELSLKYGNVSTASVGAIQRSLLVLENEGGQLLFGEPALALADLIRTDGAGRGMINILAAERMMNAPTLYATFLLWLMSELFEQLPEVGDPDKPKIAFFFDEAHLLFNNASPALIAKIEQVARLIRSKGVSVWFISQNPADLPDQVLSQLGNRVQHALRAFTAKDQKALRMAAENYRPNPAFDTAAAIQHVGTGEAVTSFLEPKGVPGIVERTLIRPPYARLGTITDAERAAILAASPMAAKYDQTIDRDSAYEILARRAQSGSAMGTSADGTGQTGDASAGQGEFNRGRRYEPAGHSSATTSATKGSTQSATRGRQSDSIITTFGKSLARQAGAEAGRMLRGALGTFLRGK